MLREKGGHVMRRALDFGVECEKRKEIVKNTQGRCRW